MTPSAAAAPPVLTTVHRVEVRAREGFEDPRGRAALRDVFASQPARAPHRIDTAMVYLIESSLDESRVQRVAEEILADPVCETAALGAAPPAADAVIEVHPLPGVMDPDAESIERAIRAVTGVEVCVHTARRYDFFGIDDEAAQQIARRVFANPVIHAIHATPFHPDSLPRGRDRDMAVPEILIRDLDDAQLAALSRSAHLFLSLEEMRAIQARYRERGREPREIELETLAQTWSEHCVHKTLKARIRYREVDVGTERRRDGGVIEWAGRPGHEVQADGSVVIHNLLKSTIAAATSELIADGIDWCLSVFVDNAGIIAFDDEHAVCFKCETHNHPSAIEPYGGAATGIGGCIRDIIGTGLAARPIASTDVFCVAHPHGWDGKRDEVTESRSDGERDEETERRSGKGSADAALTPSLGLSVSQSLPSGTLHPRRILSQVVAGVRDYGNRMGIPTLNGAVWFDDDYVGNPLVYCGCIGVMPRDKVSGDPHSGDVIVALGGSTGRDGIHGATFSSAELTDTHADEFSHAVQIGNAVTEKKMLDAILAARDHERGCLYRAITDCGAGGFSSAVGEMGEHLGAEVHLERAPLKYAGLSPTEIWISEAQERMVLAVPRENIDALREICDEYEVQWCELGTFGAPDRGLVLHHDGVEVGRLSMEFLHEGLPETVREAQWEGGRDGETERRRDGGESLPSIKDALLALLAHPNIASKHWIIRQYDHEVQGRAVVSPLVGPRGIGPSDAAVILPVHRSTRGLAIANGLATGLRDDPYVMALAAIDECVRNLVCVGADPSRIALLDNFCWPGCDDPQVLGGLVRAAEACYDAAKAYRTPFISGKDSLNNQLTTDDGRTIRIPPTLLISGFGIVPDVNRCVTMDAKRAGNALVLVGDDANLGNLGGSHYEMIFGRAADRRSPVVDLHMGPRAAQAAHAAIGRRLVVSAHDVSDGGMLVAATEMAMAGGLGLSMDALARVSSDIVDHCFSEGPSCYLLEVEPSNMDELANLMHDRVRGFMPIGEFNDSGRLTMNDHALDLSIDELQAVWRGTLDW